MSLLGYGVGDSLVVLVFMRLLTGVGEAAVFVGAATTAQDLAPPSRRGEATSYFSIAIYGGLAVGPLLGEALRDWHGSTAAWVAGAAACLVAALIALLIPDDRGRPHDPQVRRGLLQRDAVRPGIVLALAMTGYAGFATFVPLYVDNIGIDDAGPVLTVYAVVVLVIRIFGARIPDRFGAVTTVTVALASLASGLALMALVPNAAGLYAGTFVFSCGQSMMYPSLFPLVVNAAPEAERAHAIATFTMFFDLSQLGAVGLGAVVSLTDERGAFAAAGAICLAAIVVLRTGDLAGDALDEDLGGDGAAEGAVLAVDPQHERPVEGVLLAHLDPPAGA